MDILFRGKFQGLFVGNGEAHGKADGKKKWNMELCGCMVNLLVVRIGKLDPCLRA